ncbi:hypothetical protein FGO68_gene12458 [Halteria grandinella]|uniref:BZIP domain-containing protein n=1 Tax=Halteria grandinella TaxID=5974 RepID=A0A8J8T4V7_HALGN|nr:hypothetical protein FGO68_gene12458 [Halteria grandinella]
MSGSQATSQFLASNSTDINQSFAQQQKLLLGISSTQNQIHQGLQNSLASNSTSISSHSPTQGLQNDQSLNSCAMQRETSERAENIYSKNILQDHSKVGGEQDSRESHHHHQKASMFTGINSANNANFVINRLNGQADFNNSSVFLMNQSSQFLRHDDDVQFGEDDDVSNESVAEKKIVKIDRRLNKNRTVIDKTSKRRLQNRKSALKCRLRKSHLIQTLQSEVGQLKLERQSLFSEIFQLKESLKEEQLSKSAVMVEFTKLQQHHQLCQPSSKQQQLSMGQTSQNTILLQAPQNVAQSSSQNIPKSQIITQQMNNGTPQYVLNRGGLPQLALVQESKQQMGQQQRSNNNFIPVYMTTSTNSATATGGAQATQSAGGQQLAAQYYSKQQPQLPQYAIINSELGKMYQ